MGPDTGRLRADSAEFRGGRAAEAALLSLLLCLTLFLTATGAALAEEKAPVLEASGIRYPEGFDSNTVGDIEGKTYGSFLPEAGPVGFQVAAGKESYTVLASPAWYWKELRAEIPDGTKVRVRGSKTLGKDGNLYIIAQEIWNLASGSSFAFRGEGGRPLWKGPTTGLTGGRGGSGSPMKGGGGIGGGAGGMRRGRR